MEKFHQSAAKVIVIFIIIYAKNNEGAVIGAGKNRGAVNLDAKNNGNNEGQIKELEFYNNEEQEKELEFYNRYILQFVNRKSESSKLGSEFSSIRNLNGFLCGTNMVLEENSTNGDYYYPDTKKYVCKCKTNYVISGYFCVKNAEESSLFVEDDILKAHDVSKTKKGLCNLQRTSCGKKMIYYIVKSLLIETDYGEMCELLCFCAPPFIRIGNECKMGKPILKNKIQHKGGVDLTTWSISKNLLTFVFHENVLHISTPQLRNTIDRIIHFCGEYAMYTFTIAMKNRSVLSNPLMHDIFCRRRPKNEGKMKNCINDFNIKEKKFKSRKSFRLRSTIISDCSLLNKTCGENMIYKYDYKEVNIVKFNVQCKLRCLCADNYRPVDEKCILKGRE